MLLGFSCLVSIFSKGTRVAPPRSAAARFVLFCENQKSPQVHVSLLEDGDKGVFLVRFAVSDGSRETGIGSAFLSAMAAEADRQGVSIVLNADPDAGSGMTVAQLERFYTRHGFEPYWEYQGKWAEVYDGKRDGTWLRMGRFPRA
jgi:GNAT superfamily N-acetyltransferase